MKRLIEKIKNETDSEEIICKELNNDSKESKIDIEFSNCCHDCGDCCDDCCDCCCCCDC